MNHNPDLRFGRTIHLVPICIRHEHGHYGGPAGYQVMTQNRMARVAAPIILPPPPVPTAVRR